MNKPVVNTIVSGPKYAPSTYQTVVLKSSQDFKAVVESEPNKKYIVKYDFDLGGETVTVPEGCLIEMDGGTISNGTMVGDHTILIYFQELSDCIKSVTMQGTWKYNNPRDGIFTENVYDETQQKTQKQVNSDVAENLGTLDDKIDDKTDINATFSEDGKIYADFKAGDIFYVEVDEEKKYRVAYADGIADDEHPVTITGMNFYYADNSADAIFFSLRIKSVSVDPQTLLPNQKVQAQNNIIGKRYAPAEFSGLGKKVFAKNIQDVGGVNKNIMTQAFFEDEQGSPLTNTVFVIQYDYDLMGETIEIPAECTLNFDGGSLKNGTLVGDNTNINASLDKIFCTDLTLDGFFVNGEWNVEWFGANREVLNNDIYFNYAIHQLNSIKGGILVINGNYTISNTIWLMEYVSIVGRCQSSGHNTRNSGELDPSGQWQINTPGGCLIKCAFANKNSWMLSSKPNDGVSIDYDDLRFGDDWDGEANGQKQRGVRIENLSFVTIKANGDDHVYNNEAPIFGGMRLHALQNGALKNIQINGVKYGLSICYSWLSDINNLYIKAKIVGLYAAFDTELNVHNVWLQRRSETYGVGDLTLDYSLFKYGTGHLPDWIPGGESAVKTIGVVAEDVPTLNLFESDTEYVNMAFSAVNSVINTINHYFEGIGATYLWANNSAISIIGINNQTISNPIPYYDFGGTNNATVYVNGISSGKCFPTDACSYTIVDNSRDLITFYDRFVLDSGTNHWLPVEKAKTKNFIGLGNSIYVVRDAEQDWNERPTKMARLGNTLKSATVISEIPARIKEISKKDINIYLGTKDKYLNGIDGAIENTKIVVKKAHDGTNFYVPQFNNTKNCEIDYNEDSPVYSLSTLVSVYKSGKISLYSISGTTKIVELKGKEPIDVSIKFRGDTVQTDNILLNPQFTTMPYIIRVFDKNDNLITTLTNTFRPTTGVPIGYVYIENGVPIYYTGDTSGSNTGWVDATGATV